MATISRRICRLTIAATELAVLDALRVDAGEEAWLVAMLLALNHGITVGYRRKMPAGGDAGDEEVSLCKNAHLNHITHSRS